ncbi:uncharacterized protein LOC106162654 [Lingula anatina]|uniref:Uncharacterized protein LOC106162654 n=1 Tax=Lingula anatina TaxID=7574 RepID=A0A1S3IDD4_LINAN|nr:uncharacterized protein LOC106162654 [Lingula anatina]|eukprot:XP_013395449.1 uncharacterized protein LOC106162654 [Lingula anatina]
MRKAAYLPQGNSDKNYEIEVKVQAIDAIGSAAEVISTAVVYPPSAETMAAMMGNMTGPDGYIQQLARMGDAREMMQTLGVLVAYMNINNMYSVDAALAEQFNETEIALALLNAIADADLTDSERTQKDTLTARMDALRSENASAYQTWFDQRVQIRQEICQALSLMNFVSLSTGRLIVSGLRDMVKLPNEVNALAVEAIGTVAQKVWDLLDANKDAMEGPDLTANAKLLIEIIGRTLDAINAINEAGNLEADLEEILRATRTNLVTMTKYIGQGVMDKKVVGEPTTTISTTKMQVSTQLEYPDKLDKATLGAGSSGDINMPGMDSLIGTGNDTTSSLKYMVAAMKSNPYAGANATNTSGSADDVVEDLTPNSPVISLDFKNETGGEMKVQDLDDPFNIYINRDASKVQLTEVHNFTTAWDEKMVIHKIILPGNIGLSIKVWDWSPVPPQNVSNSTDDLTTTEFPETTTFDMETTTFDFNATNSTEELAGFDNTTFMVFVGIGRLPTVEVHDFNCTLPMDFSDLDVNDTTHPRNKYGLPDPSVCFMSNAFLNR